MRVASRKGVPGGREPEVSGTAKVGMYGHEPHKRHGWIVKVAQLVPNPFGNTPKAELTLVH